jgi:protein tyrosine/serine phosphatase
MEKIAMPKPVPWILGLSLAAFLLASPFLYYRYNYTHSKRLRVVEEGKFYRSGNMSAPGFREAIERYGIRTIINLQDEAQDPSLDEAYWGGDTILESDLCREMNVRFIYLGVDLVNRRDSPAQRPKAIDQFLEIMDNPDNYPVLIHCRAGLHRTGCLAAVYRMEYNHWPMEQALCELKSHGFGEFVSSKTNEYIMQYLVTYKPRTMSP